MARRIEQQRNVQNRRHGIVARSRNHASAARLSYSLKIDRRENVLRRYPRTVLSIDRDQIAETQVRPAQFQILQCPIVLIGELPARLPGCAPRYRLRREFCLQQILSDFAKEIAAVPIAKVSVAAMADRGFSVRPHTKYH